MCSVSYVIDFFQSTMNDLIQKKIMKDYYAFKINKNLTRAGVCKYDKKTIELSQFFIENSTKAEVKNVVLHELAHAITGPHVQNPHGEEWKTAAKNIGCDAKRTCHFAPNKSVYVIACDKGCFFRKHRLTKRLILEQKYCRKHKLLMKLYKKEHKYNNVYKPVVK